ncbi:SLAM family member 9-like isoform X1 [Pimephales promelas]|uniref:SLAM family member 9-like isoform X1 n=1 Tax=Pimephales promelas TaxID=90988 RepID=UPI0019555958|nr:SLAM family member 9-like isoform X1 [Pimephales promelas]
MFATMAVDRLRSFILLLVCNTGFSAEISVFVQTRDSVQLEIQTQKLPEFDLLSWINDKSETIVRYMIESKTVRLHPSYKDRVDFNDESFSLTLKNMQKTDSGLYTARTTGESNIEITYRVSVIDTVEAPVLTVNSHWSSDSCVIFSFTCRSHNLTLSSMFQHGSCSPEEVISHENYNLTLNCSEESIICNHSNTVSWKEDRIHVQLCRDTERPQIKTSPMPLIGLILFGVVGVIVMVFSGLLLYCCCKNNKGVKQSDDTDYDDVETLTQKMTGDTWTTITYHTVGHQTPSSAHDC